MKTPWSRIPCLDSCSVAIKYISSYSIVCLVYKLVNISSSAWRLFVLVDGNLRFYSYPNTTTMCALLFLPCLTEALMTETLFAQQAEPSITPEAVLEEVFGYKTFRDGQKEVIDSVVSGQDCIVIMPTGGGKSLCYQIPALVCKGLTIVISPLISLMKDQVDQLKANGVSAECINSTMTREELSSIYSRMQMGQLKLVYVSPERVLMRDFVERLETLSLSMIAVDEAHCISQWGHDFRPEYASLGQLKQQFPHVPIMALTATADEATRNDITHRLQLREPHVYLGSFDRPNIRYTLLKT